MTVLIDDIEWRGRVEQVVHRLGDGGLAHATTTDPPTVGLLVRLAWVHRVPAAVLLAAAVSAGVPDRVALARGPLRRDRGCSGGRCDAGRAARHR